MARTIPQLAVLIAGGMVVGIRALNKAAAVVHIVDFDNVDGFNIEPGELRDQALERQGMVDMLHPHWGGVYPADITTYGPGPASYEQVAPPGFWDALVNRPADIGREG